MKRIITILFLVNFIFICFGLEISPNLVYQIDTSKYQFTYEIFVKNDIPVESKITVEVIDFITDGRYYSYEEPDYKYSLRQYVSLQEDSILLAVNEQKQLKINFNVPQDFPGAMGVFALKITQESVSSGKVQLRLNYIVPFFVRFTSVTVYQQLKINSVSIRDLSLEPDQEHGNFGSLITLEIENRGNIAFIPKGKLEISSRQLKTLITEMPIDSFDLVVFPEKKTYYTFYIPYTLPSGPIDISLSGKSYGLDFYFTTSKINEIANTNLALSFSQSIVIFTEKTKNALYSFTVNNLSFLKETLNVSTSEDIVSFIPKKLVIYPYREAPVNVRCNLKDFNFSGDKIYPVEVKADSKKEVKIVSPAYIVLRGNSVSPSLKASLDSSRTTSILTVLNDGDCVLQFNVLYNNQVLNENPMTIFPGQTINLDFGRIVRSNLLKIEYSPYGEENKNTFDSF